MEKKMKEVKEAVKKSVKRKLRLEDEGSDESRGSIIKLSKKIEKVSGEVLEKKRTKHENDFWKKNGEKKEKKNKDGRSDEQKRKKMSKDVPAKPASEAPIVKSTHMKKMILERPTENIPIPEQLNNDPLIIELDGVEDPIIESTVHNEPIVELREDFGNIQMPSTKVITPKAKGKKSMNEDDEKLRQKGKRKSYLKG